MKKITLCLFVFITCWQLKAQISAYTFSQSNGTYTEITGETLLALQTTASGTGATSLDDVNYTIALPFDFSFGGINYLTGSNVYVNTNGFISLGSTLPGAGVYGAIGNTGTYSCAFSAFGADLNGGYAATGTNVVGSPDLTITAGLSSEFAVGAIVSGTGIPANTTVLSVSGSTVTLSANCTSGGTARTFHVASGKISYVLSGTAPNRSLIVQYKRMRPYNATLRTLDFQIVLNETSNLVNYVYGNPIGSTVASTLQVGVRGATNTLYSNRTTTTDWSATTAGGTNTATITFSNAVMPVSGLIYTWTPPSCSSPSGINTTSILATTATINWSAQTPAPSVGYEYYYDTVNTTPTIAGTPTTMTTADLTGLMANTLYYVWLRSDCGSGQSSWSSPFSFRTTCDVVSAPWMYDVESATLTTNSIIVDCWSSTPSNTTSAFRWNVDGDGGTPSNFSTGPNGANSGVKYFYTEASSGTTDAIAELYTPLIDISGLAAPSLQFYYHMFGTTIGELHIDIYDGSTWTNDVDVLIGQQQSIQTDPWINRVVNLAAFSGTIQVRFRAIRGTSFDGDISLDDINVVEGPSCYPPTNLTAYNITATTADINWNENGTAFDWEYVVQAPGSGIPTASGVAIDIQPWEVASGYGITGLSSNTNYEVYLRSSCSFSDKSAWIGPVNFKTECAIFTVPSLENFTTYVPGCWEEADNGDLTTGPATYGSSSWISDGFGNAGTTGSARYEIWLASANDWLITPTYTIPVAGYELKFDAAATQWNSSAAPTTPWEADDYVEVLVSTSGTSNWTVLYTYNDANVPLPTGTTNIIDLDTYAGQNVKFAFRVVEGASNGAADLNFYVDNFEIRLTPSIPPLCATNVVATPDASCGNFATVITWDAVSGANGYRINLGTSTGASDVLNNFDLGTALSYNHLGSINTNYFVTILPYNVNGNASGCSEVTYMTNVNGCYCTSTPTSVDGVGITNVQIVATDFANTVSTSPVYNDYTATTVDMTQGINNNVQVSLDTGFGYDYSVVIWIDANDNFTFESSEIVYNGLSAAAPTTILNTSFVLPGTTSLGQHRMRIVATDVVQSPSNPCYSGTYGETADFIINVIAATCTPVTLASTNIVTDCANSQFSIELNVTNLGDGMPTISDGVTTWDITMTGINTVGPFITGASVNLTVFHGSDATCDLPLGVFTYICPPANNECANAVLLPVNSDYNCGSVTSGTVLGATASAVDSAVCFGTEDDDVWYSFVATQTIHRIQLTNVAGSTTDLYHSLWTGVDCNSLTLVPNTCSDPNTSNPSGLIIGQTYYLRVYTWTATTGQTSTFDVCIGRDPLLDSSIFDSTSFRVYPNPVKDILTLEYTTSITSVRIMNLLGQEVISRNINANEAKIDMSQLNSGAYIVNVIIDDVVQSIKVIKE